MRLRLVTAAYVLFLAAVVFVADGGGARSAFAPLRALPLGDKFGHFVLMGALSLLVNLCLSCRTLEVRGVRVLAGSLLVLSAVTLEEFSQPLTPHRSFDPVDLLFDALGVLAFGRLALRLKRAPAPRPA
jgi:hypothetical protein